jgi:hypothetical protein
MADLFSDLPRLHPTEGPHYRPDDPATSREAATDLVTSGRLGEMMAATLEAVRKHPGLTSAELEAAMGVSDGRFRKRLCDLERRGKVRRGEVRASRVSGKRCETWWPVETVE